VDALSTFGTRGPAAERDTGATIRPAAKQLSPVGPWDAKQVPTCGRRSAPLLKAQPADANLRSLFGPASPEMSLWSPDRNLKTAATDFKGATKRPAGARARAERVRGGLIAPACVLISSSQATSETCRTGAWSICRGRGSHLNGSSSLPIATKTPFSFPQAPASMQLGLMGPISVLVTVGERRRRRSVTQTTRCCVARVCVGHAHRRACMLQWQRPLSCLRRC
jgi:hypothetical protein